MSGYIGKKRLKEIDDFRVKNGDERTLAYFNISPATLDRYLRRYRQVDAPPIGRRDIITTAEGPNLSIVSKSTDIRTLEQLLAFCKVDLSIWKVTKHVVNMWGGEANPNFQVKAWLALRQVIAPDPREELLDLIEEAKKYAPIYPPIDRSSQPESGNMLEISLFDHHYGQLSWGKETGGKNYDVKISRSLAFTAIDYVLNKASGGPIDRILIPIGNDFFNVDNALETTIHGTRQAEDDRWKKTFVNGRKLWVEIIEKCLQVAPVSVKIIPGNHDGERTFYLGDTLDCWFHHCDGVEIDNGPPLRKYFEWGNCFIGYTHGDREPKNSLINIMATEKPLEWSRTKYREWHKGHLHAANAKAFQVLEEERGVRELIMPSLVALDDWHSGKGYSAIRESMGMIWNKEKGKTDIFMYHP